MLPFLEKFHASRRIIMDSKTLENSSSVDHGNIPAIDMNDPLIPYLIEHPEVIDFDSLSIDSSGVRLLREQGVKIVVPLVAQGELIGLINLGPRMSEQGYTVPDRRLLNGLSTQAAIALKVAELVEVQETRARQLERMDHELQIAQIIQKTLLPKSIPIYEGWKIGSYWNPAQTIGGDFYDFINFPDGRLGIIIGDVTDKGVPAALVMAETRSILKTIASRILSPGAVLARVNDLLGPDIPDRMFITCLYVVLDPMHGHVRMANAGHNLPILSNGSELQEVMVRGMPLGIFPGMEYEEVELGISPGTTLLLYSDGISEAHGPSGEIYGTQRLKNILVNNPQHHDPIQRILDDLLIFTSPNWTQEDDITIVTAFFEELRTPAINLKTLLEEVYPGEPVHILTEFSLPSLSGNDRAAMEKVTAILERYSVFPATLERIRTAVAETALNAIEHGNRYQPELPVTIRVLTNQKALSIRITDCAEGRQIPEPIIPDLSAKLDGEQSSRGWGLFLIKSMSDDMRIFTDEMGNTVELLYRLN